MNTEGATWKAVERQCQKGIDDARENIERIGVEERVADVERGKIAAYQNILAMANQRKEPKFQGPLTY